MPAISMDTVREQLLAVLREAFEGPPERWSYFTDNSPDAGLFGTLAKLNAAQASESLGQSTIVAHVHHIAFSLEASSAWIRGDRNPRNWKESWKVSIVDGAGWSNLLEKLRSGYKNLRQAIESNASGSEDAMGGAIGAIAHMAYHLGAIRQNGFLQMKKAALKSLQEIPGVGPSIAKDLHDLGFRSMVDLRRKNPEKMYYDLCRKRGQHIDRCMLYVFRSAVYFASTKKHNPDKLLWWNWKDKTEKTNRRIR